MWGCAENDIKQGKVKVFMVKYNGKIKSCQKRPIISLMSHLQTQPHLAIHEKATFLEEYILPTGNALVSVKSHLQQTTYVIYHNGIT